jgi:CHAT domain-containing protein/tetratricopeptide (TPR) repeat protein
VGPVSEGLRRAAIVLRHPKKKKMRVDQAPAPYVTNATRSFVPLVLSTVACMQVADAQPLEPTKLQVGDTLSASQSANTSVVYVFDAQQGETYLIEVEQHGLDFVVTVEGSDGRTRSFNSPLKRDENEVVLLENTQGGAYRITLSSEELTDAAGTHEINLRLLRADGDDPRSLEGWRRMSQGAAASFEGEDRSAERAIAAYQSAARVWNELGRIQEHAQALYSVAMLDYFELYDWASSAEQAVAAATLYRRLDNSRLAANANALHASALIEQASELEPAEAQQAFNEALSVLDEVRGIHERLGNEYDAAYATNLTGLTYYYMGDLVRARAFWSEGAARFAALGEWLQESTLLQNLAVIDGSQGYYARAIRTLQDIIERLPQAADDELRAALLDNLAANHRLFGNIDDALRSYSSALTLHSAIGDRIGEAYSLRGIGNAYYSAGEFELATEYLQKALPLAKEANDGRSEEAILTTLGNIAFLRGDYSTARELHQSALDITAGSTERASREVLVAKDLIALGQPAEAIAIAEAARATAEGTADVTVADALQTLGDGHLADGESLLAVDTYTRALQMYETLGMPQGQAAALNGLALAERARGRLDDAIRFSAASLQHSESLRERVAAPELRAVYAATRATYYETHVDVLMERQAASAQADDADLRAALAASERARARVTMDLLEEASIDLRRGIAPELVDKRSELYEELAAKRSQRDRLLAEESEAGDVKERLGQVLQEMANTENELNLLEAEVRRASPQYARFASPQTLSAAEIQELVDSDSVLLHFALGEKRSFVWVVTSQSIQAVELADRTKIESVARLAFGSLRTYQPSARSSLQRNLSELSELVLRPISGLIRGTRVFVAADGALQYIPFAVLPIEIDGATTSLLRTHEVITIPSMSVLAALRARQRDDRQKKELAVFADPVMDRTDSRFAPTVDASTPVMAAADDPIARRGGLTLGRLPYSGYEADTIADLVPDEARFVATGFNASRQVVLETDLSQYRFVHFATHGLVDARYPALSALALSQFDEKGAETAGFLRLHDIYSLNLNADLVVLSACDTALGREIRGEGLMGFGQGFMFAGARRLVVSLWQVPDRATAELMTRFYRHLLKDGLRPAEALQQAQISLSSERRWSDPFFWSAFILLGD